MAAAAIIPPLRIRDGLTPKNAGFHSTRSARRPGSTEPTTWLMPWAIAGLTVYFDIALDAKVVMCGWIRAKLAPLHLHLVGGLPGADDHFADAAHGLGVRGEHRKRPQVMQNVLCGDRLAPDARLGEGDVFGDAGVEVVTHHQHVEVPVDGVDRVGTGRIGRRRQDVRLA